MKSKVAGLLRKKRKKPSSRRQIQPPKTVENFPALIEAPQNPGFRSLAPGVFAAIDEFSGVQLSVHTQRAYRKDLNDFFAFLRLHDLFKDWPVGITPIHIAQYRTHLIKARELSKGSVTRKLAVLKSFYKWAVAHSWVENNPAELVKSFPQTQESKTGFLNDSEVGRVLESLETQAQSKHGLFDLLSQCVVETLLMLGLRRDEASKIRWGHLEFSDDKWLVRIQGKGDRDRSLPIPARLLSTWSAWARRRSDEAPEGLDLDQAPARWMDWIKRNAELPLLMSSRARRFDVPLSGSEIGRIVRRSARRAGLIQRVSPHMLRATAITHALDQGASHRGVQQMAGWTSPLMLTRYDKRRKDPRFSAVLNLQYAKDKNISTKTLASTLSETPISP